MYLHDVGDMGTSYWNNLHLDMRELELDTFKIKVKEKVNLGEIAIL